MKYYWLSEVDAEGWDITESLIRMKAIHISTNTMGNSLIRRFIKELSEEDAVVLTLQFGHRLSVYPLSDKELMNLTDRGFIKS